ncbi:MAG TPA: helix-turn-helix domain-containing protein [Thermomicrobiales bacterium]|nr:helix-turn-helix domain-containing protein [Thermomicrobiales bacterium]
MATTQQMPEIMTSEQAAEYLQVNRETIYCYIRQGRLRASRLGRTYRIPRQGIEHLLWATRTRPDIHLREYTREEIDAFLQRDQMDDEARQIARWFDFDPAVKLPIRDR